MDYLSIFDQSNLSYKPLKQNNMLLTITLILSFGIAINFLLLFFSCNKTKTNSRNKKPQIIRNEKPTLVTTQLQTGQLAATGS